MSNSNKSPSQQLKQEEQHSPAMDANTAEMIKLSWIKVVPSSLSRSAASLSVNIMPVSTDSFANLATRAPTATTPEPAYLEQKKTRSEKRGHQKQNQRRYINTHTPLTFIL